MNTLFVQLAIVGGYLVLALAIGLVAYRATDRTAEDYYLAGRTLGTVVLLFTTFATLLSAYTFFGGPDTAFSLGPEWILVMGLMDGVLFAVLWYVLGYRQWLIGQAEGYVTVGELLGDRFGSTGLRVLVAGVSLFWLFPYLMLQQRGAGLAVVGLTDGAVPLWVGAGGITLFMIVYVAVSGMRGVAWTDTLQGVLMLGLVWAAFAWIVAAAGGVGSLTAALGAADPEYLRLGGGAYTVQFVLGTATYIAFGVAMFPQVNQRFFAARSEAVLKRTLSLWPVLVVLLFVPAFLLGAWAVGLGVTVPEDGSVLPALLRSYTPAWFAAVVIAGALAAMMSSSDSMLLSGSSYFTRDVYRPLFGASDRENLFARIGVAGFATASFVASLFAEGTLVQIGNTAFGGFAQLTVPVLVALYRPGTTRRGMYAGVLATQAFYLCSVFLPAVPGTYAGWPAAVVGMVGGLVLTVVVSAATAPAPDERTTVLATEERAD